MIDTRLISQCSSFAGKDLKLPATRWRFCQDTRHFSADSFFVAFPGARQNPLTLLKEVLDLGCPLVIYQASPENSELVKAWRKSYPNCQFESVADVVTFTQELARLHTDQWQMAGGKVFAISGSNGKTTHKEMLAFMLKKALPGEVVATEKNNNNHLGVPLTLLQIHPATRVCVLELGSNHPGEIKVLCDIACPNAGLVTNIGATHLEFFGTEEQVFLEEGYLYHAVKPRLFLLNQDDKYLSTLSRHAGVLSFSYQTSADLMFRVQGNSVKITGKLGEVTLANDHITGRHNFTNLATAWCIAVLLAPEKRTALTQAAAQFQPTANRSEWREHQGAQVYLDAYNANPSSMMVALEGFVSWLDDHQVAHEKALIVLGDMNELGPESVRYHSELGEFLRRWPKLDCLFIGRFAESYQAGRGAGTCSPSAQVSREAGWAQMTQGKSHVFIKGSRSLQLESLLAIT